MARKDGPLLDFARARIAIKKITCENAGCERPLLIYVDKRGWPYTICDSTDGCDHENKPHTMVSAQPLLDREGAWSKTHKTKVLKALDDFKKPPQPKPERDPFDDFASGDSEPEPNAEPEPKKRKFKLFDDSES